MRTLVLVLMLTTAILPASSQDTTRTPFRNGILVDPACDNQTQHCIDESFYFTYADTPPNPAAMEFYVDPGGGPVKVGPRRPDLILGDPQLIDFTRLDNPPPTRLGNCPDPATDPLNFSCYGDPFGGADICWVRELWDIFGYYVTVTYNPNGVQELIDPKSQFDCLTLGICEHFPTITAPMISVTTPASTNGAQDNPIDDTNGDGVRDINEICADSTLKFLQINQVSTLLFDGVIINARNSSVGGNHLATDLIAQLVAARYGQRRFSKFAQTPLIFGNGGSWGTAACLAGPLMHPTLIQGCIGSANIPDVTEFKNHMIWDSNAQGLMVGTNMPANDGIGMASGLDRGMTISTENTAIPNLTQVISPAHRLDDMDTAIFMLTSDSDFSSDAYGLTNRAIVDGLAARGKDDYKLVLKPNHGHGATITGGDFVQWVIDDLYDHYLSVLSNPPMVIPFDVDSPEPGEDSIYRLNLDFVPFDTPDIVTNALQEEFRIEDGGLYPGRWDLELLDLTGTGEPSHVLLGHGDGRVQLMRLQAGPGGIDVVEADSTNSQGFGLNGLVSTPWQGTSRIVISLDSSGEGRAHVLSDTGGVWSLSFLYDIGLQPWVGNEARIRRTTVFPGRDIVMFGSPPHFYQPGQTNAPFLLADTASAQTTALDAEVLNDAVPYDDGHRLLMLTTKGYVGDVDPLQPLLNVAGAKHIGFRKISPHLSMNPTSAIETTVLGAQHFLVIGGGSPREAVLLDQDLGIVATYDLAAAAQNPPTQVFQHPTDPSLFIVRYRTRIDVLKIDTSGPNPTIVQDQTDIAPLTSSQVQTARPFLWQGNPVLLVIGQYGDMLVQSLLDGSTLFDNSASVRSKFHGVSCDNSGVCFTINRKSGEVWQLDDQGQLNQLVATEAEGSFCPLGTEICSIELGRNTRSTFGGLRSLIIGDDGSLYPVAQRAARLKVVDAQGQATRGNKIAYVEGGIVVIRTMNPTGCHYLGQTVPWTSCDTFTMNSLNGVVNPKTFDAEFGAQVVNLEDWVKTPVNNLGHNIRYLEVEGDELIVVTNGAGWIRVYHQPSGGSVFTLIADNTPIVGVNNHFGRNCPALDVRVDPSGADPVDKLEIFRGCLAKDNEGGSLEGWKLVPGSGSPPYEPTQIWNTLRNMSPTSARIVDEAGPDFGKLAVGDLWGHLHFFDAPFGVQPSLLMRTESLRGAVGPEGIEYFLSPDGAGGFEGHLYVATGRGHYRFSIN